MSASNGDRSRLGDAGFPTIVDETGMRMLELESSHIILL